MPHTAHRPPPGRGTISRELGFLPPAFVIKLSISVSPIGNCRVCYKTPPPVLHSNHSPPHLPQPPPLVFLFLDTHQPPSYLSAMDRFLAPQSPEAQAHTHLTCVLFLVAASFAAIPSFDLTPPFYRENWFSWDQDHPSLDETLTSGCATYQAFQRYLNGADLYLVPRTRSELESVL